MLLEWNCGVDVGLGQTVAVDGGYESRGTEGRAERCVVDIETDFGFTTKHLAKVQIRIKYVLFIG